MKDMLVLRVRDFLRSRLNPGKPVIVGFSGGADSRALVHLLKETQRSLKLDIHLVHIDHGWRQESGVEAQALQTMAEGWGLPFHIKTLSSLSFAKGNSENVARALRYEYFSYVSHLIGAQAIILAHQQDDLAETVMKRMCEGAGFLAWSPMKEDASYEGMRVWRPLLKVSKLELLDWLGTHNIRDFIVDQTNLSSDFLRGRMRTEMFPYLERVFGKGIVASLCGIADDVDRIASPMLTLFQKCSLQVKDDLLCTYVNFDDLTDLPQYQYVFYLKYFLSNLGLVASRDQMETLNELLLSRSTAKKIQLGGRWIYVEGGSCFVLKDMPVWPECILLKEGVYSFDGWICHVRWEEPNEELSNWQMALNGRFYVDMPENEYALVSPSTLHTYKRKEFFLKRFSSASIPSFCRGLFPFLVYNDEFIHEFLTGRRIQKMADNSFKRLSIQLFCVDK